MFHWIKRAFIKEIVYFISALPTLATFGTQMMVILPQDIFCTETMAIPLNYYLKYISK